MNDTNSDRYTGTAIALHWLMAVMLVGLFAVGIYMHELPMSPQRLKLYNWHKWAGILVLLLALVRVRWRATHPAPPLPAAVLAAMPGWQRVAHRAVHDGLYLLLFVTPLLGWAYSSAAGFPVVWFGVLPLPDFVPKDKVLAEAIKPFHAVAAFTMAALVIGHAAAALKHQFIDRDGLLARMMPGR